MKKIIVLFTIFVLSGSVYAGGSHKGGHGQEKDKIMDHWQSPKSAMLQTNPVVANAASLKVGGSVYLELCSGCHGKNLLGDGPDGVALTIKPTNLKDMSGDHSDGDFFWKIKTGKGDMPAWEDDLKPDEIWSIVNYIQSFAKDSHGSDAHNHNANHDQ